jgi:hypothetical protein
MNRRICSTRRKLVGGSRPGTNRTKIQLQASEIDSSPSAVCVVGKTSEFVPISPFVGGKWQMLFWVVLTVYADESQNSDQSIFALAGILGSTSQWESLFKAWVAETGGAEFHAADCEGGYKAYRGVPHDERHRHHRQLTGLLAESGLIGWGVVVDIRAAREAFPESRPDQSYYSALLRVLKCFGEKADLCIPRDNLEFIFDRHPETEHNSGLMYKYVMMDRTWGPRERFAEAIRFSSRCDTGIQVADLFVRELLKVSETRLRDIQVASRPQWQ